MIGWPFYLPSALPWLKS